MSLVSRPLETVSAATKRYECQVTRNDGEARHFLQPPLSAVLALVPCGQPIRAPRQWNVRWVNEAR
jgi:hypothetical protein